MATSWQSGAVAGDRLGPPPGARGFMLRNPDCSRYHEAFPVSVVLLFPGVRGFIVFSWLVFWFNKIMINLPVQFLHSIFVYHKTFPSRSTGSCASAHTCTDADVRAGTCACVSVRARACTRVDVRVRTSPCGDVLRFADAPWRAH